MTNETSPVAGLTDQALQALLKRAIRDTVILGLVATLILLFASGWRNASMFAVGAIISAASILEWQRLIRLLNDRLDHAKTSRGAGAVVVFFMIRLAVFAAAI